MAFASFSVRRPGVFARAGVCGRLRVDVEGFGRKTVDLAADPCRGAAGETGDGDHCGDPNEDTEDRQRGPRLVAQDRADREPDGAEDLIHCDSLARCLRVAWGDGAKSVRSK